jgi:two-component system, OmpR family, aerobic respiration control protein ArcA
MNTKELIERIEKIKKERMLGEKVVLLDEFKKIKHLDEPPAMLVIDDDPAIRNAIKRIFEKEGYDVCAVNDGTALKDILEKKNIKIIILDVGLPWVDGFELCKLFREHDQLRKTPVVILSAYNTDEDIRKGYSAGCNSYIAKPFNVEELTGTVRSLLDYKEGG